MSEYEAETLQTQAQTAGVTFVEQVLAGKRMTAQQLARVRLARVRHPAARPRELRPRPDPQGLRRPQDRPDAARAAAVQARQPALRRHVRPGEPAGAGGGPLQDQPRPSSRSSSRTTSSARRSTRSSRRPAPRCKDMATLEDIEVDLEDGAASRPSIEDDTEVEDAPVVKYLQKILIDAIAAGASDIHFEPYEKFYRVRYRHRRHPDRDRAAAAGDQGQGRVADQGHLQARHLREARAAGRPDEARAVEDARRSTSACRTLPTLYGEKIVMRILDSAGIKLGIEALGYEPDQQEALMHAIGRPYGMILVTGPTGSGKTVSLYTCLNILNQPGVNISTAEDPAEIQLAGRQPGQRQRQGRAHLRHRAARRSCGRIRTSSWSAKSATSRPPTSRSRRRRRATSCCRRCTPTTRRRR